MPDLAGMKDEPAPRVFGCDNCGGKMTVYPPDGSYTEFFVKECCKKSLERAYECGNCDHKNVRYWCIRHMASASASVRYKTLLDRFGGH